MSLTNVWPLLNEIKNVECVWQQVKINSKYNVNKLKNALFWYEFVIILALYFVLYLSCGALNNYRSVQKERMFYFIKYSITMTMRHSCDIPSFKLWLNNTTQLKYCFSFKLVIWIMTTNVIWKLSNKQNQLFIVTFIHTNTKLLI